MKRTVLTLALLAAAVTSLPAVAQSAKDFEELRNEVLRLRKEMNEMRKAAPAAAAAPVADAAMAERLDVIELKQKDAVVVGDIPGSFRIPGSETSIKLYGYAELNAIHEMKGDNFANDYSTFLPYAPLRGQSARKNGTLLTARTSRLGIESSTPTPYGPFGVKLEGDFNNDPRQGGAAAGNDTRALLTQQATNSYGFRLRQATGTFAGFTVGQTWSTFMDLDNSPETVDFNGPIGSTFLRQPLVKYTYSTPELGGLTVALENSVSYVVDAATGLPTKDGFSKAPDLIVRWDKSFEWGNVSVRGLTLDTKVAATDGSLNASKRGYGVGSTAFIKTREGQDFLSLAVTYGDGIGRYFNYIDGALLNPATNQVEMERTVGLVAGYQYKASDMFRANVVAGWQQSFHNRFTDVAKDQGVGSGQYGFNKQMYQLHAGFFYTPVKNIDLGAEYIWGERKTLAGEKGDLSRVNLLARYTFN